MRYWIRRTQFGSRPGVPWPEGLPRAVIGAGFYCWPAYGQAFRYRKLLRNTGARDLKIVRYEIERVELGHFRSLDLTKLLDDEIHAWMSVHSEYGSGPIQPHGYDWVIRETNNVGKESYFSPSAFAFFHPKPARRRSQISPAKVRKR